jgi:hypothetical protein
VARCALSTIRGEFGWEISSWTSNSLAKLEKEAIIYYMMVLEA